MTFSRPKHHPHRHADCMCFFGLLSSVLQVRADKQREVKAGHDGSWVAHPALVGVAMEQYNEFMPQCNQLFR